ncbi:flagella basal body P-ring formation protein FlgA [Azomonas agilis]|uniref:Flagella basal body P-ring formation protein FlgA n=1 Tax=Azomonas agilis TaxID=116849 RepID=A0A562I2R4_9GAMM|nr:flagella basal body P-ring formation protein FlgA [Azomonas agilis]
MYSAQHLPKLPQKHDNDVIPAVERLSVSRRYVVIILATLYSLSTSSATLAQTLPAHLIEVTQSFLEQITADYMQRSAIEGRYEVEVNRLDSRFHLTHCEVPATASLENPAQPVGRVTVRLQCEGQKPWTIFMPAQVRLYRDVVVSRRTVQRQTLLTETDLMLAEREVGQLPQGYLSHLDQALGSQAARNIAENQVITPAMLQQAQLIRKGEQVIITARRANINVQMPGEALSNGVYNQQIPVKNLGSGRVVKARVISQGHVEAGL